MPQARLIRTDAVVVFLAPDKVADEVLNGEEVIVTDIIYGPVEGLVVEVERGVREMEAAINNTLSRDDIAAVGSRHHALVMHMQRLYSRFTVFSPPELHEHLMALPEAAVVRAFWDVYEHLAQGTVVSGGQRIVIDYLVNLSNGAENTFQSHEGKTSEPSEGDVVGSSK